MRENMDQKNLEYGNFSRSVSFMRIFLDEDKDLGFRQMIPMTFKQINAFDHYVSFLD